MPRLVIWLVPQLFLAPVVGIASRWPSRPLAALRETLRFATANLGRVGGPVLTQALFLLGIGFARVRFDQFGTESASVEAIAYASNTVGLNVFPHTIVQDSPPAAVLATLACVFASVVFMTSQWLGVRHGYDAVDLREVEPDRATA